MKNNLFILALYLSALTLVAGCATTNYSADAGTAIIEPGKNLKFNDVPVPAGFKILAKDSYVFDNGGVRVGLLKYQGKADADLLVNFYKEQMKMYNWELLNIVEFGERMLNFNNEKESCIVTLSPKGSTVNLFISLGPRALPQAKRAPEPQKRGQRSQEPIEDEPLK